MTNRIGILAYGSLIDDPGIEIDPIIYNKKTGIKTPFQIEFARSSSSRGGAPTIVPVTEGGARVNGVLLELEQYINLAQAVDLLWRRETRNEKSDKHYSPPANPGLNHVLIKCESNFEGFDKVIYTHIGANISDLSPEKLANLAIASAQGYAGKQAKDGISYLLSVKRQGITTPLMPKYEASILKKIGANTLQHALEKIRGDDA